MRIDLPENVNRIIHTLEEHGFEAYVVGGCVRDVMLGRMPQDWDITTSAQPKQVKALFPRTVDTGIRHGTVTVLCGGTGYEVTTYRIDGEYEDARHPKYVLFTPELPEDLKRRDFTVNAMAYNETRGLVDAFGGAEDLRKGIIRCVGNPKDRFAEDALRMLRAVRFAAQLDFSIEEQTRKAIRENAPLLAKVSAERIQAELVKLLVSGRPQEIRTAYELSLTAVFLPEFDWMMETPQQNKHHCYTVGEHTVHSLEHVRADKVLRLTMLLHDVAKPQCMTTDEAGQNHFKGHPGQGEKLAESILRRLKFDNDTIRRVCRLVRFHDERPPLTEESIRRTVSRIGIEQFPALFAVKRADTLAQSGYRRAEKLRYIEEFEQIYHKIQSENQCIQKKDLAVSGQDLIAMGMHTGKEIGSVLEQLFEEVLEHPEWNEREKLLELAHKLAAPFI